MKTRHLSIGLRRTLAILLMAVLLLSDHRVLYAAEAVVSPSASGSIELQTEPKEKAGTVSDGDVGDDTASGKEKSLQKIQEILQILTTNRIVRKTLPKPSPGRCRNGLRRRRTETRSSAGGLL